MSKVVKSPTPLPNNPSLDETRPSARQLASGFSNFNPARYLNKYETTTGKRETALVEDANTELRDPEGALHNPIKLGDWLTGLGAALAAILDSARLRREFRPLYYAIGCAITLMIVAVCGGAFLLVRLLSR